MNYKSLFMPHRGMRKAAGFEFTYPGERLTDENSERNRGRHSLRDRWKKQPDYIPGRVRNVA
jgi:hypothetical protein